MQYLFIVLFMLASCGQKNNEVSSQEKANVFTSKYEELFLSEDGTQRAIILNTLVENKLNNKKVSPENFYRLNTELREYERQNIEMLNFKEEKLAKLYVSYEDKLVIYFMPEKVDLSILEKELNLPTIPGNIYSWARQEGDFTKSGDLLILVSTNIQEIIENDKNFYVEKTELTNHLTGVSAQNGMRVKLKIETDYSIQSLVVARKEKRRKSTHKSFSRDCVEAGNCSCAYSINQTSLKMEKYEVKELEQVRFQINVGERMISSENLKLELRDKNKIEAFFDIENEENNLLSIQFENKLFTLSQDVYAFNAEDSECGGEREVLNRKIEAKQRVVIEKWGRGESFLQRIKL